MECNKATFDQPLIDSDRWLDPTTEDLGPETLSISRGAVAGSIILAPDCAAAGLVNLSGTTVAGSVQCHGRFAAISGRRASISGDVHLARGFTASEEVTFAGAQIGGDLDCEFGRFHGELVALDCGNANISGHVLLSKRFRAVGQVNLDNVTIGKSLNCETGQFEHGPSALSLESAHIAGAFVFKCVERLDGPVNLTSAHVGVLEDDMKSWAGTRTMLSLAGFTYDRLTGPTGAQERVAWLKHQSAVNLGKKFLRQPWEQLISALRAAGHPINARKVAIAKNDGLRRAGKVVLGARTLHWMYGALVDYGYRPAKLLGAIVLVWFGCALIYGYAVNPRFGSPPFLVSTQEHKEPPASFSKWFYSADVLLPIVGLGYKDKWTPDVSARDEATAFRARRLREIRWLEILIGWVFGGVVAAMLAQLVKKD